MVGVPYLWKERSRWTVLVACCWAEAITGLSYVFSTFSADLKSQLGYDQRHINRLAAAKDLGDHVGLAAGFLCRLLPSWAILLVGAALILVGYGFLWLLTSHDLPALPFLLVCIMMFIGTNGSTYLDTAVLLICLSSFSSNRAMVVGLLKGFKGLSGAIFNQIYAGFLAPDQTSFILFIALVPAVVIVPLILMMGSAASHGQKFTDADSTNLNFHLLYGVSVLLAAYMLIVTVAQALCNVSGTANIVLTIALLPILLLPLSVQKIAKFISKRQGKQFENPLLEESHLTDDEKGPELESSNASVEERSTQIIPPGTNSSVWKAIQNMDFWLLVFSIFFSMGSGTTAFDNLTQIAQAQGYDDAQMFVSMTNIWNFMGRLIGGYVSEVMTRRHGHPRALLLAAAQVIMAIGHVLLATALPGTMYVAVFCVAGGYGAEWAIFPTTLSELFGLQNFAILYNFVSIASPAGSLIFSTAIAGPVYDAHAKEQGSSSCEGVVCFETTFFIMASACIAAMAMSLALAFRTRSFYTQAQSF